MSKDKNEPTSSKQRSDEAKSAAPPTAFRNRMSLEKKLGIAFIGMLLVIFFSVLGVRLSNIDTDDERVEVNIGGPASVAQSMTPPTATLPLTPTNVAERMPSPVPAATMPQAPTTNMPPPRYAAAAPAAAPAPNFTAAPTSPTYGPPSGGPSTAGSRYASTALSNAMLPPPTTTMTPPPSSPLPPPTNLSNSPISGGNTNPMRATSPPPSGAPYGGSPYGGSSPAGAATPTPPGASLTAVTPTTTAPSPPPSFSPTNTPTNMEPRPIGNSAASAQPLSRDPGVASIGFGSGTTSNPTSMTAVPPQSAISPSSRYSTPSSPATLTETNPPTTIAVAAAPPSAPRPQAYVVAPGDSFWSIAEKTYGDGSYYRALFAFNSDRYPHAEDVRTGSVLDVPTADVLRAKYPELCGPNAGPVAAGGVSPAMTGRTGVAVAGKTYVVQDGDTLFDIARRQLGKAAYWSEIYNLNRAALGENLERLQPGTELILPAIPAQP